MQLVDKPAAGTAGDPSSRVERREWMSVLAKATGAEIAGAWEGFEAKPDYAIRRAPETGLVMVQARAGGTGQRFNLGEMTVTRSAVELEDGTAGCSYVAGSDTGHAEIAAVFDALLCTPGHRRRVMDEVIAPLRVRQERRRREVLARTAATRVDFFTLVRGDEE